MKATHGFTLSGHTSIALTDTQEPIPDRILRSLTQLNGKEHFAFSLWPLPAGKEFHEVDPDAVGTYLQCAGSAKRMMIEMREEAANNVIHHRTVGRRGAPRRVTPHVKIRWSDFSVRVFPNEAFDAAEASAIFYHYYLHGTVPEEYELRPL
jgi:hypothetical protein